MAQEVDDLCFDNLDEFINDENKRVTYKWLSHTLSIHVNQAKQLLYSFVTKQRNEKENDALSVTYAVTGLYKHNGITTHKVQIVPEEKLESAKRAYNVVTSCHVYSVQRGKLKDPNTLYMTDYEIIKQNILNTNAHSPIQCPLSRLRGDDQMEKFAQVKAPDKPAAAAAPKQNASSSSSSKPSKPSGIAGMFASKPKAKPSEAKKSEDKTEKSAAEAKESSKAKPKEKAGGMMSFFGKQSTGSKPKETKAESTSSTRAATGSSKTTEAKPSAPKAKEPEVETTKRGVKHKGHSDSEESVHKKRRRVKLTVESSDEDEEDDDIDMESPLPSPAPPDETEEPVPAPEPEDSASSPEIIPPSPEPEPKAARKRARSRSPDKPQARPTTSTDDGETCGKVRKRKLQDKTFINDEGFMVTEKVWVDEWEDVAPEKKASPVKSKDAGTSKTKKNSPPPKKSPGKPAGKQQTMMSFFKKK